MTSTRRTGTYVAFHAQGQADPSQSDLKYFNLLKAWKVRDDQDFSFTNSHEKTAAIRDRSKRPTIERHLKARMLGSKNMVLILTKATKLDTDWVPFEIRYAVDECEIPIIAAYPNYDRIMAPAKLRPYWPSSLAVRIDNGTAHVIHIPFKQAPLRDAVGTFGPSAYPKGGGLGYYSREAYASWGLL